MKLRFATYNIHRSIGRGGIKNALLTADVIKKLNADVIALQEVAFDSFSSENELTYLAKAVGAEVIPGPTLLDKKDLYGNAVLSRITPFHVRRMDISIDHREPRGAIEVTYSLAGITLKIVATHIGLRPYERRRQIRRLLSILDGKSADITILLGDFNEWFLWSRPLNWIQRRFGKLPAPATFPARFPLLSLDRIWVHPADCLISMYVITGYPAIAASDHLPLVADIDLTLCQGVSSGFGSFSRTSGDRPRLCRRRLMNLRMGPRETIHRSS